MVGTLRGRAGWEVIGHNCPPEGIAAGLWKGPGSHKSVLVFARAGCYKRESMVLPCLLLLLPLLDLSPRYVFIQAPIM